jgi:hypothetical protein
MSVEPLAATLGTGGRNGNFTAAFTVPASMTLVGYAAAGPGAVDWYRSIDVEGARAGAGMLNRRTALYPASKAAAVKAVLDAAGLKYRVEGTPYPWSSAPTDPTSKLPGASSMRIFFSPPSRGGAAGTPYDAAAVTTLLANLHTAITT